ncbi:MAG: SH3 domain-containing protein [Ardenticatenales bacterium]|nr:SH3 domain-containing protein [Ardenticatenales bacterium]
MRHLKTFAFRLPAGFVVLAGLFLFLILRGSAPLAAADTTWMAEYFNNTTLSGPPAYFRQESDINHDWGTGSPAPGINADNFSACWMRVVNFSGGTYRFSVTVDDGVRLYVDDQLLINAWYTSNVHTLSADTFLAAGDHYVRLEYYEAGGNAIIKLNWSPLNVSTPTPTTGWRGEYYNNQTLSGTAALVRTDPAVDFNWGVGTPAVGLLAADHFSVRWTQSLTFNPGRYRFVVNADDGARLWVNNTLLVDKWVDQQGGALIAEIDLPGALVPIKLEYYEDIGGASVKLAWTQVISYGTNQWQGEYYNNTSLSGAAALVRTDSQVNFNWGTGTPAVGVINSDNFSVRWTQTLYFSPGNYRFTTTTDDGVRLWVNNVLLIDRWQDRATQSFSADLSLPGGSVPLRMEYYEHAGLAEAHLTWSVISGPTPAPQPTPQPTPKPTPTPPPLPTGATATVISDLLNLRTGPSPSYNIIRVLTRNQVVRLAGYRNLSATWVQVITADNVQGWVYAPFVLSSYPLLSLPVWSGSAGTVNAGTAIVIAFYLNVRTGPDVSYTTFTRLLNGQQVTLTGYRNGAATWVQIITPEGQTGWVNQRYLLYSYPIEDMIVWSG